MIPDHRAIVPMNGSIPSIVAPHVAHDNDVPSGGATEDFEDDCSAFSSNEVNSTRDYPIPRALQNQDVMNWCDDLPAAENFAELGRRLVQSGDLYRNTSYASGLLLASPVAHIPPTPIKDAATLNAVIVDRQPVRVVKDGKIKGTAVPSRLLKTMLASECFLQEFPPIDEVVTTSKYLADFSLTRPGYNNGGYGQRSLHIGEEPWVELRCEAIPRFLGVMDFASESDRTNTIAAAFTVLLRNLWPGGKPCVIVTSSKSHGGKETIVQFAAGTTRQVSISYESADWALQKAFVAAVKHDPSVGLIDVENVRLDRGQSEIRSAFLERFLTDSEPLLYSPGTGSASRRPNDIVVAITRITRPYQRIC